MVNPLKKRRQEKGLRAEDMSNITGLSLQTIHCYETGIRMPPAKHILRLAGLYGLTDQDILDWLKFIEWKSSK